MAMSLNADFIVWEAIDRNGAIVAKGHGLQVQVPAFCDCKVLVYIESAATKTRELVGEIPFLYSPST